MCACDHVKICENVCGVQKRESDAQELEFQVVVSHQTWMLRTKLGFWFLEEQCMFTPELSPVPLVTVLKQDLGSAFLN